MQQDRQRAVAIVLRTKFFFYAEDGIRDLTVTGVQTCALPILRVGARYVDITPESRHAADDPTLVASDGLHPSAKMYAAWVELALPVALNAIGHGALDAVPSPDRKSVV